MLRSAVDLDPSTLDAYRMLGQLYVAQGRLDAAREEFVAIAKRDPGSIGALTMAGMISEMQGRPGDAIERYEDVLGRDRRAAIAANNLAWLYATREGELNRALELAQIARTALPDRPEVSHTLGWIYYLMDLPANAVPLLEDSVRQAPGNAAYHYHLGMAHVGVADFESGEALLARALELRADFDGASEARATLTKIRTSR